MLERLAELEKEFLDVEARLGDPGLIADQARYQVVAKRYRELEPIVERIRELQARQDDLATAREMLSGATNDERDMVRAEVEQAEAAIERLTGELRVLLLPRDPNDERNVIVEIRGAEGGEEANLFARDLFEMYRAFAARRLVGRGARHRPLRPGGFNEVTFAVKGDGVWGRMNHEAGPHRVQRVRSPRPGPGPHVLGDGDRPPRGRGGRRRLDPADLRIDVYRSSGPGGST